MKQQYISFNDVHRLCSKHCQAGEWLYKDAEGYDTLILGTGESIYLWDAETCNLVCANGISKIDLAMFIETNIPSRSVEEVVQWVFSRLLALGEINWTHTTFFEYHVISVRHDVYIVVYENGLVDMFCEWYNPQNVNLQPVCSNINDRNFVDSFRKTAVVAAKKKGK